MAEPALDERLEAEEHSPRRRPSDEVAKRLVDMTGSAFGLIVLAPLMAGVALLIRMVDGSPVMFRQPRAGRGGRPFEIVKFRTMAPDAESGARCSGWSTRSPGTQRSSWTTTRAPRGWARGDADDQDGHHEERSRIRERNVKCTRRQPDTGGNRHPQRKRLCQRRQQPRRLSHHGEPLHERLHEGRDQVRQPRRQHALDPEGGAPEPLGMPRQGEQHDEAADAPPPRTRRPRT